jgi:tRNA A-37 threonylcarbamoyl transferase component Bud32
VPIGPEGIKVLRLKPLGLDVASIGQQQLEGALLAPDGAGCQTTRTPVREVVVDTVTQQHGTTLAHGDVTRHCCIRNRKSCLVDGGLPALPVEPTRTQA